MDTKSGDSMSNIIATSNARVPCAATVTVITSQQEIRCIADNVIVMRINIALHVLFGDSD